MRKKPGKNSFAAWPTMASSRLGAAVIGLCALCSSGAALADKGAERLSVSAFQARVEGNLPELAGFEADVASAQVGVAKAAALAPVQLSYEREHITAKGNVGETRDAASAAWSLDLSGRRRYRIKSAEGMVRAATHAGTFGKNQVLLSAMRVYYAAAKARLTVESLQETRRPVLALVEGLRNRVAEGDASGYDLARFELHLAEHDNRIAEANTALAVAQAELAALVGGAGTQIIATSTLTLPTTSPSQGKEERGDLRAAAATEKSGRDLERAASRWWIPTLKVSVGYLRANYGAGTMGGTNPGKGYAVSVSATLPIFSRGEVERKRGEARGRQALASKRLIERRMQVQVQSARARLSARLEQTRAFEQQQLLLVAKLAARTEAAFKEGEASALELQDAYHKLSESELRFIELRYQCRLAQLAVHSALGTAADGDPQ